MIRVNGNFYYDVGLRRGNDILSKYHIMFSERQPRYLEDFIEINGKNNVKIISYGSLLNESDYIDGILK